MYHAKGGPNSTVIVSAQGSLSHTQWKSNVICLFLLVEEKEILCPREGFELAEVIIQIEKTFLKIALECILEVQIDTGSRLQC